MKHFIIYKTTNLINGKFYIGKHTTENVNDNYLGSGIALNNAIKLYGKDNFKKEILFECKNEEELSLKESELVNEEFCNRKDTYNICHGGYGGNFNIKQETGCSLSEISRKYWNQFSKEQLKQRALFYMDKYNKDHPGLFNKKIKDSIHKLLLKNPDCLSSFKNKKHTEESKIKISNSLKNKYIGSKNPSFGTIWICNDILKLNKRIKSIDSIPQNWRRGRNMSYITIK